MGRIKLIMEYDGSNYHGFQIQKNAHTVQAELEKAIYRLSDEQVTITCAGRTDAGVHALGQVVAFDSGATIPGDKWTPALNSFLPADIQVLESRQVKDSFNPRFDAVSKRYIYKIYRRKNGASIYRNYSLCNTEELDLKAMQEGCGLIEGRQNFRAFCASGSSAKTFERRVIRCQITEKEPWLCLEIEADGFLYNMVRIITGTILQVGRSKYSPEYIKEIISLRDRTLAGPTVPPQGLYLVVVNYPPGVL
ncbi:MAG: tRNA pseudouridine(38-40) synthase TruA [Syntrophomonas sp.]